MTARPQTGVDAGESSIQPRVVSQDPGVHAAPPRTWTVPLPYLAPPLNANRKVHHQKHGRITKQLRHDAGWAVHAAGVPALLRCRVELHYVPATARGRDADNLWPTYKPCADGVMDAGVVGNDTPEFMEKPTPVFDPVERGERESRLYLVITDLGGEPR